MQPQADGSESPTAQSSPESLEASAVSGNMYLVTGTLREVPLILDRWSLLYQQEANEERGRTQHRQQAEQQPEPTRRFEFPEPQSLRGIPAIGRGVRGAITELPPPGSDQHLATIR